MSRPFAAGQQGRISAIPSADYRAQLAVPGREGESRRITAMPGGVSAYTSLRYCSARPPPCAAAGLPRARASSVWTRHTRTCSPSDVLRCLRSDSSPVRAAAASRYSADAPRPARSVLSTPASMLARASDFLVTRAGSIFGSVGGSSAGLESLLRSRAEGARILGVYTAEEYAQREQERRKKAEPAAVSEVAGNASTTLQSRANTGVASDSRVPVEVPPSLKANASVHGESGGGRGATGSQSAPTDLKKVVSAYRDLDNVIEDIRKELELNRAEEAKTNLFKEQVFSADACACVPVLAWCWASCRRQKMLAIDRLAKCTLRVQIADCSCSKTRSWQVS